MTRLRHCEPGFEPLLSEYGAETLDDHPHSVLGLRLDGTIAYVNPAYFRFAVENHGDRIVRDWGLGANLFDGIQGPAWEFFTKHLAACSTAEQPWHHDYDCPSDTEMRRFHLIAYPLGHEGLLLVHSLAVSAPHRDTPHAPSDDLYRPEGQVLLECYQCRRFKRRDQTGAWDWVPDWVRQPPAERSGGLCHACFAYYFPQTDSDRPR